MKITLSYLMTLLVAVNASYPGYPTLENESDTPQDTEPHKSLSDSAITGLTVGAVLVTAIASAGAYGLYDNIKDKPTKSNIKLADAQSRIDVFTTQAKESRSTALGIETIDGKSSLNGVKLQGPTIMNYLFHDKKDGKVQFASPHEVENRYRTLLAVLEKGRNKGLSPTDQLMINTKGEPIIGSLQLKEAYTKKIVNPSLYQLPPATDALINERYLSRMQSELTEGIQKALIIAQKNTAALYPAQIPLPGGANFKNMIDMDAPYFAHKEKTFLPGGSNYNQFKLNAESYAAGVSPEKVASVTSVLDRITVRQTRLQSWSNKLKGDNRPIHKAIDETFNQSRIAGIIKVAT